jgi:hypothetical protein
MKVDNDEWKIHQWDKDFEKEQMKSLEDLN